MPDNGIDERQNSHEGLKYLCAYSSIYTKTKVFLGLQFFLTIPIGIVWSVVLISFADLKPYMILYSFSITMLDVLVLDRLQSKLTQKGALIQEMFDCFVFEIPWRKLQVGEKVDLESLNEEENRYLKWHKNLQHLRNWFVSDLSGIPLLYASLIAQRTNLVWDTRLRKRYVAGLIVLLAFFAALVILFSIKQDLSLRLFFSTVLAVLSPAFIWGIREVIRHRESISKLIALKAYVDGLWQQVFDKTVAVRDLQDMTVEVQTELYRLRSRNPLIFNWVYKLLKDKTQRHVDDVARDLIIELRKAQVIQ